MKNILVARKGKKDPATGLYAIHLHAFARISLGQGKSGYKHIGQVVARSGLANRQTFRTWANQKPGIYEPCPEGHYTLGPIDWKGAPNDYSALWPVINSPIWIPTSCTDLAGRNRAIGIHLDAGTPGTAGCLGLLLPELKKLVNLYNGYGAFTDLYCDWGLGSVQLPAGLAFPGAK